MRLVPPANLIERLERLNLATAAQVMAAGARVRKLAAELGDFESVWIDALAQAKVITPWQAAELNAGRGEQLVCGNYLLTGRLGHSGFAECYLAKHQATSVPVRLYLCSRAQRPMELTLAELQSLIERAETLEGMSAVMACGSRGDSVWAVCPAEVGTPASHWLTENGRLPPAAVLQIARAMAEQLAALERQGIVHGDLCASGLLLERSGRVGLPAPGLRAIVRPQEGTGFADLRPEAYDYLAPERVALGTSPDVFSDLYACGLLWWHLLAGRTPLSGGNTRAKLQAVQAARVVDIRSLAQSVPAPLAQAMENCLAKERSQRPASFAQLADLLGAPSDAGRELVASLLGAPISTWRDLRVAPRARRARVLRPATVGAAGATAIVMLVVATLFGLLRLQGGASHEQFVATSAPVPPIPISAVLDKPDESRIVDPAVRPAAASRPADERTNLPRVVEDLVLPTGEVLRIDKLELAPGMRVRGRGGRRPVVSVPAAGLEVRCENVTFEGIDFVWQSPAASVAPEERRSIIQLHAQTVNFRGCSFNARASATLAAIQTSSAQDEFAELGIEVSLLDCVFDGLSSVIEHRAAEPLSARLENCLCVASGPILQLSRCLAEDRELRLSLDRVTTRGDTSVLQILNARALGKPGPVTITAAGCALAGTSRAGVISLIDAVNALPIVKSIAWSGQGSVVSPRSPMLTSQSEAGTVMVLADDELAVAGLVRGDLEFSGRADGPPTDSRVVRWQVPLRSSEPPGADPERLRSLRSARER